MTLQQLIIGERNSALTGREIPVMIDSVSGNKAMGRTMFDAYEVDNLTTISKASGLKPGDIIKARIIKADSYDFTAEPVQ